MKKILVTLMVVMLLSACSGIDGTKYSDAKPKFDLKAYFTGPIKAWGIVQDRSGNVVSRFDIVMHGKWIGNNGTLVEDFSYYDGTKQRRIWKIIDRGDGTYEGRADDIIDKAEGSGFGNAGQWSYVMDVPVGDSKYRLRFDDWMWAMNDGVLMNRSYMKKFGITVAEVTIFMKKQ
jgi:hypothetical protein